MKLKQPDTWECKLSQEGNKAATWEKLIGVNEGHALGPRLAQFLNIYSNLSVFFVIADGKSLPFMAMLRNLRNMISVGISEKHHTKILNRLTSKVSIS